MGRTVAIIPARGGSKGLPGKNWRDFCGKPLVRWSVEQALAAETVDEVIVSSDSVDVYDAVQGMSVTWRQRPLALAGDTVATAPVLIDVLESLDPKPDAVVLLQPTSPLRLPGDIDNCVRRLDTGFNSLLSVYKSHHFIYRHIGSEVLKPENHNPKRWPRRQEMNQYSSNGSIYTMRPAGLQREQTMLFDTIGFYEMPEYTAHQIDSEFDWDMVEWIMKTKILEGVGV